METLIASFKEELRRVELKHELNKVRVVVLNPVPRLEITLSEGGPFCLEPLSVKSEAMLPVWLVRILKARGYVAVHKDEQPEGLVAGTRDRGVATVSPFFYNTAIDWLDSVSLLQKRGHVSEQTTKKYKSQFISFLNTRFKQLLSALSAPTKELFKRLSEEEIVLATAIHGLLKAWDRIIINKEED